MPLGFISAARVFAAAMLAHAAASNEAKARLAKLACHFATILVRSYAGINVVG